MSWITLHYTAPQGTALHPYWGSARVELCFRTAQCSRHFLQPPPLVVCSRRQRQRRCQAQQVSLLQIGNGNGIWMGIYVCVWLGMCRLASWCTSSFSGRASFCYASIRLQLNLGNAPQRERDRERELNKIELAARERHNSLALPPSAKGT